MTTKLSAKKVRRKKGRENKSEKKTLGPAPEGNFPTSIFEGKKDTAKDSNSCSYCPSKKGTPEASKTGNVASYANVSREDENLSLSACTTIDDKKTLKKRARRKHLGGHLAVKLATAAEQNQNNTLDKSYWNTYHCAKELTQHEDGKITGKYCKTRWCPVCSAIKTAKLIKKYQPVLEEWREESYFVTLTAGATTEADYLRSRIRIMGKASTRIRKRMGKQFQRGKSQRFQALRKLECTYRPKTNEFHPHYHFVVKGKKNAETLKMYWLEEFPAASAAAQDVRKCTEGSETELFKYFTKLITGKGDERVIYADAMDIIFNAVKGVRTYQPIGFRKHERELSQGEEVTMEEAKQAAAIAEWTWDEKDWKRQGMTVDYETGEVIEEELKLSGYEPGEGMKELAEQKIIVRKDHSWKSYIFIE